MEDIIVMSARELKRLHVICKVLERRLTRAKAAEILRLSTRQIKRLVKRVRGAGDKGIIHGLRGKRSNRKLPDDLKQKVIDLYKKKYPDFGIIFANEKLREMDAIEISNQTLRNWLIETGLWQKTRKVKTHRQWRERKAYFGEMVQMDGSQHAWLEDRGHKMVLMACIDDATNNIYGRFYDYEGAIPAMDCFKRYIKRYGLPQSLYIDKHTTYKSPRQLTPEEELEGVTEPLSAFGMALKGLGVERIHANSPQAKGRIERLFETLQDRLVKEMRLAGIKTKDEANEFLKWYLPVHNRRFGVAPAKKGDLHRPAPVGIDLNKVLCIRTKRALRNDFTVAHNKRLYQILDMVSAKSAVVEERTDGRTLITHNGRVLRFKEILSRPERPKKPFIYKSRKKYIPSQDHPWRKSSPYPKKGTFLNVQTRGHF